MIPSATELTTHQFINVCWEFSKDIEHIMPLHELCEKSALNTNIERSPFYFVYIFKWIISSVNDKRKTEENRKYTENALKNLFALLTQISTK